MIIIYPTRRLRYPRDINEMNRNESCSDEVCSGNKRVPL
jgi:hypothetical protein